MKKYKLIDHTADIGIEIYGRNLAELFRNSAHALFDLMLDMRNVKQKLKEKISVTGGTLDELLKLWLSQLLYLFCAKGKIFKRFEIDKVNEKSIEATAYGESFNAKRHRLKTELKAVTYHKLKVRKSNNIWKAFVIIDV